jgi:adenosylhomocysteine nucleosidase
MLIIHTALHAEARALIEFFGLKRQHDIRLFACFACDHVFLIESGIGKTDTATAIGWTGAYLQTEQPVWLNVGMAGHANHEVGCLRLAHRIEDQASSQRFYPPQILHPAADSDNLVTVDQPADEYPPDAMVDMEASAFIRSASRFSSIELVQSVKVISDNLQHPPDRMKAAEVEALISPHLVQIDQIAQQLLQLRQLLIQDDSQAEQILERWHFSQYQRNQLRRLLQRYHALNGGDSVMDAIPQNITNSKHLIKWLNESLDQNTKQY